MQVRKRQPFLHVLFLVLILATLPTLPGPAAAQQAPPPAAIVCANLATGDKTFLEWKDGGVVCPDGSFVIELIFASEPRGASTGLQAENPAPGLAGATTRIEVDEQKHVIRFFIEGEEKARLDAAGLHVRENIGYGGTITDYGPIGFDGHERQTGKGRDEP